MLSDSGVRYVIDPHDKISSVDEGWCDFARANNGAELLPPNIIGQPLWNYIADLTTADLYRQIVSTVRKGKLSTFNLRCDSPSCRRLLEMTITGLSDGYVEFKTETLQVEEREPVPLLALGAARSTQLLRSCAWCNLVDVGFGSNEWVEIEEAMARLRLFELEHLPQLTHGICDECHAGMKSRISEKK